MERIRELKWEGISSCFPHYCLFYNYNIRTVHHVIFCEDRAYQLQKILLLLQENKNILDCKSSKWVQKPALNNAKKNIEFIYLRILFHCIRNYWPKNSASMNSITITKINNYVKDFSFHILPNIANPCLNSTILSLNDYQNSMPLQLIGLYP